MKKTITKKTILKAIQTEPLTPGYWVKMDPNGKISEKKDCEVCAVGGVLRRAGMSNKEIDNFGEDLCMFGPISETEFFNDEGAEEGIRELIDDGQYLHALSVKFELLASKNGTGKRTRNALCKFVEENFPGKIELNPEL